MSNAAQALAALAAEWAGAVVVAIGGGPSLTQAQVDYCRGKAKIIAINNAVYLAPWADLLYFCDAQWYRWHERTVQDFKGARVTLENHGLASDIPGLICLRNETREVKRVDGHGSAPDGVRTGNNSGYQVLQLAAHLSADKIVLLGYDMRVVDGRGHWHEEHPVPTPPEAVPSRIPIFRTIAESLHALGVDVVNATPGSALDAFRCSSLEEALC